MRTEDLIEGLARQAGEQDLPIERRLGATGIVGVLAGFALFLVLLGPRADVAEAILTPWYPIKLIIMGALATFAFPIVTALARPGARAPAGYLLFFAAALALAVLADLVFVGVNGATSRMIGRNAADCVFFIPILAVAPFIAAFIALKHGAPTRPGLTGAAAGLLSGAIGGLLYGMFCPDDSPLFVVLWYTIGISMVTVAGILVGRLTLRW